MQGIDGVMIAFLAGPLGMSVVIMEPGGAIACGVSLRPQEIQAMTRFLIRSGGEYGSAWRGEETP